MQYAMNMTILYFHFLNLLTKQQNLRLNLTTKKDTIIHYK